MNVLISFEDEQNVSTPQVDVDCSVDVSSNDSKEESVSNECKEEVSVPHVVVDRSVD
jgi:hypothetical protein